MKRMLIIIAAILVVLILIIGGRLLALKNDVEGFRQYWLKQQTATPPANAITYVALGDSAAQGLGASRPERGYVGQIATALQAQKQRPVRTINLSVTGAKIADALKTQLPTLKNMSLPADAVVTIEIGANDLSNYDSVRFKAELSELYSQLPKQTVVADMPYFGGGRFKMREAQSEEASKIVHEVAAQYGLRVANLHQITQERDSLFVYGADFFHPNDRGYHNWFSAFWQVLGQ